MFQISSLKLYLLAFLEAFTTPIISAEREREREREIYLTALLKGIEIEMLIKFN